MKKNNTFSDKQIVNIVKSESLISIFINFFISIIGLIKLIYDFTQLWNGDEELITWITLFIAWILIILILARFSFRRNRVNILVPNNIKIKKKFLPYYPRLFKFARILLIISILIPSIALGIIYEQRMALDSKFVILIAEIDGAEPISFRFTEQILYNLKQKLYDHNNTIVSSLNHSITEQEGSETAVKIGKNKMADLIVWGWYGVTNNSALLTLHIENLSPSEIDFVDIHRSSQIRASIAEINSFTMQQKAGQGIGSLVLFLTGLVYFDDNDYENAIQCFNVAINEYQLEENFIGLDYLYYYKGITNSLLGNYENAENDFSNAINQKPDQSFLSELFSNRAIVNESIGNIKQAFEDFDKSIEYDPLNYSAFYNRGNLYRILGQYNKALNDYNDAIKINPQFGLAYNNRGVTYNALRQYDSAITNYSKAIQINSNDSRFYYNRGTNYQELDEHDLAIKDFNIAIDLNSQDPDYFYNRGNSFYAINDSCNAIDDFSMAITLDPLYTDAYNNRGNAYAQIAQFELAINDYSQAISLRESDAILYYNRAFSYEKNGQPENALTDFNIALFLTSDQDLINNINSEIEKLTNFIEYKKFLLEGD